MKKAALKETITKKPSHRDGVPALTTVRFLVRDAPFEAGQEVVFPRATADRLITSGVAVDVEEQANED